MPVEWVLPIVAGIAALIALFLWRPLRSAWREAVEQRAREQFITWREQLEAKFFDLASSTGKPRGLRWTDCEFEREVAFARNRRTGSLCGMIGVTISFEAIEGGGMEEVEAVSNLRAATAVFQHDGRRWHTNGQTLFNLSPSEAIDFYRDDLERVQPVAATQRQQ